MTYTLQIEAIDIVNLTDEQLGNLCGWLEEGGYKLLNKDTNELSGDYYSYDAPLAVYYEEVNT